MKVTLQDGQSLDIQQENIEALQQLFPELVRDGKVNFDVFRQVFGDLGVLEEGEEKFGLNWHGKKKARHNAFTPSMGTLLPCPEESVDWDTTQNLFIEGDNLEVLKLLQKSYANKVKMIYIDPPYNTGNEFIYNDDFKNSLNNYLLLTGQINDEGLSNTSDIEIKGRKHANWLTMIYPRLLLAKQLLSKNGAIFISIGEDELGNLKTICDEIFGEENFITVCSRVVKTGGQKGIHFSPCVDYILCYAKNINELNSFREELSQNVIDKVYTKTQIDGSRAGEKYRSMGLYQAMLDKRANQRYFIECPDGTLVIPPGKTFPEKNSEGEQVTPMDGDGVWRWTYKRYSEEKLAGNIEFIQSEQTSLVDRNGEPAKWNIYYKIWLNDRLEEGQVPGNILAKFESRHASSELKKLDIPFDFPKPSMLVKYLMNLCSVKDNEIVLDFFAGSGTTGHAVLDYSNEMDKTARFICVQLPEILNVNSQEYKQGFRTIADISKERIKRVSLQWNESVINKGFRIFKLAQSNIQPWNVHAYDLENTLDLNEDHLISGRTELDVLYELLLKRGIDLATPIEKREINSKTIYSIGYGAVFACLDNSILSSDLDSITLAIIEWHKELAPANDTHIFFKDSAFQNDVVKTNLAAFLEQNGLKHVRSL
ncbi:site-specific DNA-methyltransferase [Acinetobacter sp. OYA S30]|uniref:site-specific DNA-methyltransferase n=1 Tax=Acinetobacter sp. OYA S30 TaxID=3084921 RepID=UPI00298F00CE|nr:site-specific DNA-methyltransferase [Acinetobacter sp. OYA S30]MDW8490303.1 site-specific DNA-methyltransferase [Acinetobacter sp. OYA S30]